MRTATKHGLALLLIAAGTLQAQSRPRTVPFCAQPENGVLDLRPVPGTESFGVPGVEATDIATSIARRKQLPVQLSATVTREDSGELMFVVVVTNAGPEPIQVPACGSQAVHKNARGRKSWSFFLFGADVAKDGLPHATSIAVSFSNADDPGTFIPLQAGSSLMVSTRLSPANARVLGPELTGLQMELCEGGLKDDAYVQSHYRCTARAQVQHSVRERKENPASKILPRYTSEAQFSRSGGSTSVVANDPRPLLQVVRGLRAHFGWVIHYEDAPYSLSTEVIDISSPERGHAPKTYTQVAGKEFKTQFPNVAPGAPPSLEVLQKITADYHHSGNPGLFRVQLHKGRLAVVGYASRDSNRPADTTQTALDSEITLPKASRSGADTLEAIFQAAAEQKGLKILLASGPLNPLVNSTVEVGGTKPIRALLSEALELINPDWSWDLLYGPSEQNYMFNLVPKQAPVDTNQ